MCAKNGVCQLKVQPTVHRRIAKTCKVRILNILSDLSHSKSKRVHSNCDQLSCAPLASTCFHLLPVAHRTMPLMDGANWIANTIRLRLELTKRTTAYEKFINLSLEEILFMEVPCSLRILDAVPSDCCWMAGLKTIPFGCKLSIAGCYRIDCRALQVAGSTAETLY